MESIVDHVIRASDLYIRRSGALMLGVVRIHVDSWKHYESSMHRLFNRVITQGAKSKKKKPSGKETRRARVNQMLQNLDLDAAAVSDIGAMSVAKSINNRSFISSSSFINYGCDPSGMSQHGNDENEDLASTITGKTSRISGSTWAHSDIDRLLAHGSKNFDSEYLGLLNEEEHRYLNHNDEDQFCPALASLALDTLDPHEDHSPDITPLGLNELVSANEEDIISSAQPLALQPIEESPHEGTTTEEAHHVNNENINPVKRKHKIKTVQRDTVVTQSQGTAIKEMNRAPWNHHYKPQYNIKLYQLASENRWIDNYRTDYERTEVNSVLNYDGSSLIRSLGDSYIGDLSRLSGWLCRHISEYEDLINEFTAADIEKIRGRNINQYPVDAVTPAREDRNAYRGGLPDDDHLSERLTNLSASDSRRNDNNEFPSRDLSAPDKRRGVDVEVPTRPLDPERSLLDRESDLEQSDSGLTPSSRSVATSILGSEIDPEENVDDSLNPSDFESLPEPDDQEIAMRSFTMRTFRVKKKIESLLVKRGDKPLYFHEITKTDPCQKAPLFWQLLTLVTSGDLNVIQESPYGHIKIVTGSISTLIQKSDNQK